MPLLSFSDCRFYGILINCAKAMDNSKTFLHEVFPFYRVITLWLTEQFAKYQEAVANIALLLGVK